MPETFYLRVLPLDPPEAQWLLMDTASREVRLRGTGPLSELHERLQDVTIEGELVLLLPGESVFVTRTKVPSRQPRQIEQAVPFLVEDMVASDVETLHFATGERDGDSLLVAAIDNQVLESTLQALVPFTPGKCVPDLLLVPTTHSINVLLDDDRAHIRLADGTGLSSGIDQLPLLLSLLKEEDELAVYATVEAADRHEVVLASLADRKRVDIVVEDSVFEFLASQVSKDSLTLLQGKHQVAEPASEHRTMWLNVAILSGCALFLHLVLSFGQGVYLGIQADQLRVEAESLYSEVFPRDRNVRDIRRRWSAHLRGGADVTDGFLTAFGQVAEFIPGSNLQLQNVNFNESRGDLVLQMVAGQSEQLVLFAETLTKSGITAEIGTISQEQDGVRGSVKVRVGEGT